jgi:hypothetical protein
MVGLVNRPLGSSAVPLRAFCWKARGGSRRLPGVTEGVKEKRK